VLEDFLWMDSVNANNEASTSFAEVLDTIKFLGFSWASEGIKLNARPSLVFTCI